MYICKFLSFARHFKYVYIYILQFDKNTYVNFFSFSLHSGYFYIYIQHFDKNIYVIYSNRTIFFAYFQMGSVFFCMKKEPDTNHLVRQPLVNFNFSRTPQIPVLRFALTSFEWTIHLRKVSMDCPSYL